MRKIAFILVMLLFAVQLSAKEEQNNKYGVYLNYGLNMYTADFRALPGVPNCCPQFEDGSGMGLSLGLLFEIPLMEQLYLSTRLGYTDLSGELSREETTEIHLDGTPTEGAFTHYVDADIQAVNLSVLGSYEVVSNLSFNLGLGAGSVINGQYEQIEEITKPEDRGTFVDEDENDTGKRTRNESSGELPELNSLRLFATTGLSYELPLNEDNSLRLAPEVYYTHGLSDVVNGIDWKINEFKGGIALKYTPVPEPEYEIQRDTIIIRDTSMNIMAANEQESVTFTGKEVTDESVKEMGNKRIYTTTVVESFVHNVPMEAETEEIAEDKSSGFLSEGDLKISAKGVNYDGKLSSIGVMKIEEFISDVIHPLLPYVFFDDNSSEIPNRYNLISSNETGDFTENDLYDKAALEVYYHLLNIVGKRMKEEANAIVTFTGTNSNTGEEEGNTNLSLQRAKEVKEYLVDVWGINETRIKTISRNLPVNYSNINSPDGVEENRRVEISSNRDEILKVVAARDTLRKADPPAMRFYPELLKDIEIDNWKIQISQNNQVLKEYKGTSEVPEVIDWNLEAEQDNVPRFDSPLEYKLIVEKDGESSSVSSELPLEQLTLREKAINKVGSNRVDKFNLILFDFNSAEISGRNTEIVDLISDKVQPTSNVTIKGFTDRMGDEELNQNLSEERAKSTNEVLNLNDAEYMGFGEKYELYNNDLPEGRMYNRTVEIVIETPIE